MSAPPAISTVGQLRASGHEARSVHVEIRENLLAALREGRDPWPGMHGFGQTVVPQLERALLAGHDVVLLGERGQGKTRLLRSLVGLLDEWTPVIEGSELGEHPYEPITVESRRRATELGGDKIRVNAIAPGWVMTERQVSLWLDENGERQIADRQALKGRLHSPDIARMALFLAADDSRMCSKQTFVVDAGWI